MYCKHRWRSWLLLQITSKYIVDRTDTETKPKKYSITTHMFAAHAQPLCWAIFKKDGSIFGKGVGNVFETSDRRKRKSGIVNSKLPSQTDIRGRSSPIPRRNFFHLQWSIKDRRNAAAAAMADTAAPKTTREKIIGSTAALRTKEAAVLQIQILMNEILRKNGED